MGLLDFIRDEYGKAKKSYGLLSGIPKTFKNNPRNAETMDAVFGLGGIVPGIGDAVSAAEAKYRYDQGDMLGAGLAGVGALPVVPSLAGMFVGKGAKTWDVLKEAEAMKRLKSGENPAQVWRDTGVAVAPWDKQVRGEIADNAAKVSESVLSDIEKAKPYIRKREVTEADLRAMRGLRDKWDTGEFIPHQQFANAYPETTKIPVELDASIDAKGSWDGSVIRFSPEATSNDMSSTTIHELQHATQQREGFASGGSPEAMRKILSDDPAMQAIYSSGELNDAYRRLAGEAEARLTQHRIPLSAEERLSQYPYDPDYFQKATGVPLDSLIVRYGNGQSMSVGRPRNHLGQVIPPTPYELAHAEAQRVAALPVEQGGLGLPPDNTAMDRAKAMGFDIQTNLYHYTGQDIKGFSPNPYREGTFTNTDPTRAAIGAATGRNETTRAALDYAAIASGNSGVRVNDNIIPLFGRGPIYGKDIPDIPDITYGKYREALKNTDNEVLHNISDGGLEKYRKAKKETLRNAYEAIDIPEETQDAIIKSAFPDMKPWEIPDDELTRVFFDAPMKKRATFKTPKGFDWKTFEGRFYPDARGIEYGGTTSTVKQALQRLGYTGSLVADEAGSSIGMYRPDINYRSRFAAFNPAKRDSADLLAGLAPWALPVGATLLGGSFLLPPEEY